MKAKSRECNLMIVDDDHEGETADRWGRLLQRRFMQEQRVGRMSVEFEYRFAASESKALGILQEGWVPDVLLLDAVLGAEVPPGGRPRAEDLKPSREVAKAVLSLNRHCRIIVVSGFGPTVKALLPELGLPEQTWTFTKDLDPQVLFVVLCQQVDALPYGWQELRSLIRTHDRDGTGERFKRYRATATTRLLLSELRVYWQPIAALHSGQTLGLRLVCSNLDAAEMSALLSLAARLGVEHTDLYLCLLWLCFEAVDELMAHLAQDSSANQTDLFIIVPITQEMLSSSIGKVLLAERTSSRLFRTGLVELEMVPPIPESSFGELDMLLELNPALRVVLLRGKGEGQLLSREELGRLRHGERMLAGHYRERTSRVTVHADFTRALFQQPAGQAAASWLVELERLGMSGKALVVEGVTILAKKALQTNARFERIGALLLDGEAVPIDATLDSLFSRLRPPHSGYRLLTDA